MPSHGPRWRKIKLTHSLTQPLAVVRPHCGETVDHFLFRCPRWSNLRPQFKRLAANRWGDLSYALGESSNERKDGHLDKWTPQTAMVSATINFAIATGRLEDRSKECNEEESEEEKDSAAEEADA